MHFFEIKIISYSYYKRKLQSNRLCMCLRRIIQTTINYPDLVGKIQQNSKRPNQFLAKYETKRWHRIE